MFGFKAWREKRKFKHVGWIKFHVHYEKFWIFPEKDGTLSVTFWENGYGKRKVTGDETATERSGTGFVAIEE